MTFSLQKYVATDRVEEFIRIGAYTTERVEKFTKKGGRQQVIKRAYWQS